MKTFIKANVASLIASACDYGLTVLLVEAFDVHKVRASICGTVFGGVINFFISRNWVFKVSDGKISLQSKRYLLTWLGNLLLNAGGVYVLIELVGMKYIFAKLITSLTVAFAYNYPLQKKYVFKNI